MVTLTAATPTRLKEAMTNTRSNKPSKKSKRSKRKHEAAVTHCKRMANTAALSVPWLEGVAITKESQSHGETAHPLSMACLTQCTRSSTVPAKQKTLRVAQEARFRPTAIAINPAVRTSNPLAR